MNLPIYDYVERFFMFVGGFAALWALYISIRATFSGKITWKMALKAAEDLLTKIEKDDWRPDLIVGLGRSGALWGGWLAGNLGSLPIAVINRSFVVDGKVRTVQFTDGQELVRVLKSTYGDSARVLAVEGAATSGQPFLAFQDMLNDNWPQCEVKYAALYSNKATPFKIEYVARPGITPYPEEFPWHRRRVYRTHLGPR